jgi:hypothetical protein
MPSEGVDRIEKPIPDGQEVVHPEEGDSYCARCVVDLIGAERDALARQLAGAVARAEALERAIRSYLATTNTSRSPKRSREVWREDGPQTKLARAVIGGQ